eukprot:TRINITY_DN89_c0_g1_i1.p1 TRINITY_DN89_c0_g1~~TRINITY_DN89_c0_g1_i1.p1  ORF type:complete len:206 (+),score=12.30 TRINITY_DN89_c0_g1_i1:61-618(+)
MARLTVIAFLLLAVSATCVSAKVYRDGTLQWRTIQDSLLKKGGSTTFLNYVASSGLTSWLTGYLSSTTTGYTVFIPEDLAWVKLPPQKLRFWSTHPNYLKQLIQFHMLNFQAKPAKLGADKVGQGYVTFRGNSQIQKYTTPKGIITTLGPQFATTGPQLANITKELYRDPTVIVYQINNVLFPVK